MSIQQEGAAREGLREGDARAPQRRRNLRALPDPEERLLHARRNGQVPGSEDLLQREKPEPLEDEYGPPNALFAGRRIQDVERDVCVCPDGFGRQFRSGGDYAPKGAEGAWNILP
ncbi:MAG TPA: hypothetical protein VFA33_24545 [Bryobacteraceae bacterium]|nr:hypothetical protein [Bryobacteraceae bacterium]